MDRSRLRGRFPWEREELKLDCLPTTILSFDALAMRDLILKYVLGACGCGYITEFPDHQVVKNREVHLSYRGHGGQHYQR